MPSTNLNAVVQQLQRAVAGADPDGPSDGDLVELFAASRDEAAFAELVRRHGRMVLGVCRRVVGHSQDAEDAFQATFLVLAKKAGGVRPADLVGNWLYGVAYRTASQARAANARRRGREMQVDRPPEPAAAPDREPLFEIHAVLDQELDRLPDKLRAAVVLCELEGRSREEAARLMGVPEGTLSSRLAAARKALADRLGRRGVALPAGGLAAFAGPAVSEALASSTVQAAVFAAAGGVAAGAVSANVAALTTGVMRTMYLTKLKIATAVLLAAGVAATGAGVVASRALADNPAAKKPAEGGARKPAEGAGNKPAEGGAKKPGGDGQPRVGPKDGDKPAAPATGGRGEPVTVTGKVSKEDTKRKRDDGSEVAVSAFFLTESNGNKVALPAPRVNEGGKVLDSFSLADMVGKTVTATGRGWSAAAAEGSDAKRVVKVISLSEVKEVK